MQITVGNFYRQYFAKVCDVPDAEKHFGMDKYIDYTTMTKPTVVISIGELVNLHKVNYNFVTNKRKYYKFTVNFFAAFIATTSCADVEREKRSVERIAGRFY